MAYEDITGQSYLRGFLTTDQKKPVESADRKKYWENGRLDLERFRNSLLAQRFILRLHGLITRLHSILACLFVVAFLQGLFGTL